jgi:predicted ArsR family transcriptional regulator
MALDDGVRDHVSDAKRRILERVKRSDSITAPELAAEFGLTDTAVRQHLEAMEPLGLVVRSVGPPSGRGRPPVRWSAGAASAALFPDRHGELTVELIDAIRDAFGDDGVDAVIAARTRHQRDAYRSAIGNVPVSVRVRRLASIRSAEGYLADVTEDGDAFVLTEHHCPICDAATSCQGFCRNELELFQDVLGSEAVVERTSHLLSGDTRCAYRITKAS